MVLILHYCTEETVPFWLERLVNKSTHLSPSCLALFISTLHLYVPKYKPLIIKFLPQLRQKLITSNCGEVLKKLLPSVWEAVEKESNNRIWNSFFPTNQWTATVNVIILWVIDEPKDNYDMGCVIRCRTISVQCDGIFRNNTSVVP